MYELSVHNQNKGGMFSIVPTGITAYFDGSKYFLHPAGNTPIETAVLLKKDPVTKDVYVSPWDPNEGEPTQVGLEVIFSADSLASLDRGTRLNSDNYQYCFNDESLQVIDKITELEGWYTPDEVILLVVDILQEHPVFPSTSGKPRKTTPEDILFILKGITGEGIFLSDAIDLLKNVVSASELYSIMADPRSSYIKRLISLLY